MGELGELLRKAREAKGLSLAQVEEATKIRSVYLQALEEENYELLPASVYVKGFLKNYALSLGLDPQQVLALYRATEAPLAAAHAPVMLNEPLEPFTARPFWPIGLVLLISVLLLSGWWGYQQYYGKGFFTHATPTHTLVPPTLTPSPTFAPSPTWTISPTPTISGLQLGVEVTGQRAWLLVQADGERVFAGILEPGASNTWTARERITLRCGNAGAVRVTVNGQALGLLGQLGQVVEKEWAVPGVSTSTPIPLMAP